MKYGYVVIKVPFGAERPGQGDEFKTFVTSFFDVLPDLYYEVYVEMKEEEGDA